jgi:hypothetical protein
MTKLSRSFLAGVLALTLMLAGCNHACGLEVCFDGLVITFDSSFVGPGTYDISVVDVPLMFGPVASCTYAPNGFLTDAGTGWGWGLRCASQLSHTELDNMEMIHGFQPKAIQITVRSNGVVVAQKAFSLTFTTTELNGPGCGTCTNARVTMSLN